MRAERLIVSKIETNIDAKSKTIIIFSSRFVRSLRNNFRYDNSIVPLLKITVFAIVIKSTLPLTEEKEKSK